MIDTVISIINSPNFIKILFLTFAGFTIRQALVLCGQRWANTYHHLGSYLLLPNIAWIITSIIKDDIALSLGMIGALSIVRFRNPVKSPFELVMFFALLTLGIVASVNLILSVLLFLIVIIVIIGIKFADFVFKKANFNLFQYSFGDGNLNYSIEVNTSKNVQEIEKNNGVINFYIDKENKIYTYRIVFSSREDLNKFHDKIKDIPEIISIKADLQS